MIPISRQANVVRQIRKTIIVICQSDVVRCCQIKNRRLSSIFDNFRFGKFGKVVLFQGPNEADKMIKVIPDPMRPHRAFQIQQPFFNSLENNFSESSFGFCQGKSMKLPVLQFSAVTSPATSATLIFGPFWAVKLFWAILGHEAVFGYKHQLDQFSTQVSQEVFIIKLLPLPICNHFESF